MYEENSPRAMTTEIREGWEVGEERLPGIYGTARIFAGVDTSREPIPIVPSCTIIRHHGG